MLYREQLSSSNLANSVSPSHVIRCYMIPHLSRTPELYCERWKARIEEVGSLSCDA